MRIALVHDYLNQYGGGERVLEALMEIFPEAPVYTLFYDKEKTNGRFEGRVRGTSFLNNALVASNHRFFIPLMPLAAESINLKNNYDLIISSSAGYGKGISYSSETFHISYCHTPLRYAWETENYLSIKYQVSGVRRIVNSLAAPAAKYLRKWDYQAGQKPNVLLANSKYISGKIEKYYGRQAEVLHPPVDLKIFYPEPGIKRGGYFLAVGRMLPYKRFDLIINAFAKLGLPLKIVGAGPEEKKLRATRSALRANNIEFLPFANESELRGLYNGASALIFPQVEDFGLVAAEAQACGAPVIAFSEGGAGEIVQDGVTGIFFNEQTEDSLIAAARNFLKIKFDSEKIQKSAERFSKEKFQQKILQLSKSFEQC